MRLFLYFIIVCPVTVAATELHVPAVYPTVQSAVNVALPFDEVVVAPGTYTGTIFTQNKDITIRSQNPDDPDVVNNTKFTGNPAFWCSEFETFTVLDGFHFSGSGSLFINGEDSSISIRRCIFAGSRNMYIVDCRGVIEFCEFNSTFYGSTQSMLNCNDAQIRFCTIIGNGGGMGVEQCDKAVVIGCQFAGLSKAIWNSAGIEVYSSIFEGNVYGIDGIAGYAIHNVTNSIFTGNDYAIDTPVNLAVKNCAFSFNTINFTGNGTVTPTYCYINAPGQGNFFTYPYFTSPGWRNPQTNQWIPGDYHLLSQSPFFNAGDPSYVAIPSETDADGSPRIEGGRVDVGPYEQSCSGPDFDGDDIPDACDQDLDNDGVNNQTDVCDYTPAGSNVQSDGTIRGDLDGDCDCDLVDFSIFQSDFTGSD